MPFLLLHNLRNSYCANQTETNNGIGSKLIDKSLFGTHDDSSAQVQHSSFMERSSGMPFANQESFSFIVGFVVLFCDKKMMKFLNKFLAIDLRECWHVKLEFIQDSLPFFFRCCIVYVMATRNDLYFVNAYGGSFLDDYGNVWKYNCSDMISFPFFFRYHEVAFLTPVPLY